MTLSYKWATKATAAASTTSFNVDPRLQAIDQSALPLLFLHAITAAHTLQVSYLWIDSLCILQDSEADFDQESALMSKIYRNAYCTISADLDGTSELGLFRTMDVENDSVEFELKEGNGMEKCVRAVKREGWWESLLGDGVLQHRGWCLQERELSPRILHYTPTQILWECRALKASQGHPSRNISLKGEEARILDTISNLTVPEIHNQWHHTISNYSARRLTK